MSKFSNNLIQSEVLNVNSTQVGTDADTNEKTLGTYTLPANKLNSNAKLVRICAWGTFGATINSKITKLYFGSTNIYSRTAADNGLDWSLHATIIRTGASAQKSVVFSTKGNAFGKVQVASPAEDTTSGIIIKVTGQNAVAQANDIVLEGMVVEFFV